MIETINSYGGKILGIKFENKESIDLMNNIFFDVLDEKIDFTPADVVVKVKIKNKETLYLFLGEWLIYNSKYDNFIIEKEF